MYYSHRLWDPWGGVGHVTMGYLGTLLGALSKPLRCLLFLIVPDNANQPPVSFAQVITKPPRPRVIGHDADDK